MRIMSHLAETPYRTGSIKVRIGRHGIWFDLRSSADQRILDRVRHNRLSASKKRIERSRNYKPQECPKCGFPYATLICGTEWFLYDRCLFCGNHREIRRRINTRRR